MSTTELVEQKADLVHEIWCMDDEEMIKDMLLILKKAQEKKENQRDKSKTRNIGFLKGIAKVTFHDDEWEMTPEELGIV